MEGVAYVCERTDCGTNSNNNGLSCVVVHPAHHGLPTFLQEFFMNIVLCKLATLSVATLIATVLLGGCAGMTEQEKGTATGAVIGGVAGNVLCGGGVLCTGVGAAVGGAIGHEVTKEK